MVDVKSRNDLVAWLSDKPREWAQVIAVRAALRVLPMALIERASSDWDQKFAQGLFRAVCIAWTIGNLPSHNMFIAAANAVNKEIDENDDAHYSIRSIYAVLSANTSGIYFPQDAYDAVGFAADSADADYITIWESVSHDFNWLNSEHFSANDAKRLTHQALWLNIPPENWDRSWQTATVRLLRLDPSYSVWIDWYERRIKGERAAFDIPGDTDRTEDKAILIRLADATDEDFWGKGATHVNTTLQSWIDEARIEAQIQEIVRKLRGGASAHYGAQDEMDKRAALLAELDRMLGKPPQGRFGIGGNSPPEPIDLPSAPVVLPQDLREPIEAISAELEKTEPDALVIAEKATLLHRAFKKLKKMASSAADKAADAFGTAVGTAAGVGLVSYVGLSVTGVLPKILDWLAPLIH